MKLVVEPSAGAGLAAALAMPTRPGEKVGVVLCGGNIDLSRRAPFRSPFLHSARTKGVLPECFA